MKKVKKAGPILEFNKGQGKDPKWVSLTKENIDFGTPGEFKRVFWGG